MDNNKCVRPTYPRPPKPGFKLINSLPRYYKVSKYFDMNISFEELIKHNKTCKINLNSTHHFEAYENILIYVTHPESKELFDIQLGVNEDGIVYEGDYGCEYNYKEIPIEEGLDILMKYMNFIKAKNELEHLFSKNNLNKDIITFEFK